MLSLKLENFCLPKANLSHLLAGDACCVGVHFTCIVDPNIELACKRIKAMQQGNYAEKWAGAKAFKSCQDMLQSPVTPTCQTPSLNLHDSAAMDACCLQMA